MDLNKIIPKLLRERLTTLDLDKEKIFWSCSHEKLAFYRPYYWLDLISAVSHQHQWIWTDKFADAHFNNRAIEPQRYNIYCVCIVDGRNIAGCLDSGDLSKLRTQENVFLHNVMS